MRAKTPHDKGMSAARRGKLMRDNPYDHATESQSHKFWEWQRGYCAQAVNEAEEARARLND